MKRGIGRPLRATVDSVLAASGELMFGLVDNE